MELWKQRFTVADQNEVCGQSLHSFHQQTLTDYWSIKQSRQHRKLIHGTVKKTIGAFIHEGYKYHGWSGLQNNRNSFLTVLEVEAQGQCSSFGESLLPPASKWPSFCCVLTWWEGWGSSFIRALISFTRVLPLWLNHLPKASPNTIMLWLGFWHMNFGGTQTFSPQWILKTQGWGSSSEHGDRKDGYNSGALALQLGATSLGWNQLGQVCRHLEEC